VPDGKKGRARDIFGGLRRWGSAGLGPKEAQHESRATRGWSFGAGQEGVFAGKPWTLFYVGWGQRRRAAEIFRLSADQRRTVFGPFRPRREFEVPESADCLGADCTPG